MIVPTQLRFGWLRPTARLAFSPVCLAVLVAGPALVVTTRLLTDQVGMAGPVGMAAALASAGAASLMVADEAETVLRPVPVSPARRALQRSVMAALVVIVALGASRLLLAQAWPDAPALALGAAIALAVVAAAVTLLVRPLVGDASTASAVGVGVAIAVSLAPQLFPPAWIDWVPSWMTEPVVWIGVMVVATTAVLRRR